MSSPFCLWNIWVSHWRQASERGVGEWGGRGSGVFSHTSPVVFICHIWQRGDISKHYTSVIAFIRRPTPMDEKPSGSRRVSSWGTPRKNVDLTPHRLLLIPSDQKWTNGIKERRYNPGVGVLVFTLWARRWSDGLKITPVFPLITHITQENSSEPAYLSTAVALKANGSFTIADGGQPIGSVQTWRPI